MLLQFFFFLLDKSSVKVQAKKKEKEIIGKNFNVHFTILKIQSDTINLCEWVWVVGAFKREITI